MTQLTTPTRAQQQRHVSGYDITQSDIDKSIEAVFDANGVRLDHTPTDEEINYLWDKVRTCLHRDGSVIVSGANSAHVNAPQQQQHQPYNNKQPSSAAYTVDSPNQYNNVRNSIQQHSLANVNTKYIDGNTIDPQYRAQTRVGPSSGYGQANGVPRAIGGVKKVTSMDTLGSLNRRQALLNQRKRDQGTISYHQPSPDTDVTVQTSVRGLNGQKTTSAVSDAVPSAGNLTSTGPGIYPSANGKWQSLSIEVVCVNRCNYLINSSIMSITDICTGVVVDRRFICILLFVVFSIGEPGCFRYRRTDGRTQDDVGQRHRASHAGRADETSLG